MRILNRILLAIFGVLIFAQAGFLYWSYSVRGQALDTLWSVVFFIFTLALGFWALVNYELRRSPLWLSHLVGSGVGLYFVYQGVRRVLREGALMAYEEGVYRLHWLPIVLGGALLVNVWLVSKYERRA